MRINEQHVSKAHYALRVGDVLTFPLGPHIRVIKVVELGTRRGPASEAQGLYEDLNPPQPRAKSDETAVKPAVPTREPGAGRPTKRDRRAMDKFREEGGA